MKEASYSYMTKEEIKTKKSELVILYKVFNCQGHSGKF